jgi:hypothetical protein
MCIPILFKLKSYQGLYRIQQLHPPCIPAALRTLLTSVMQFKFALLAPLVLALVKATPAPLREYVRVSPRDKNFQMTDFVIFLLRTLASGLPPSTAMSTCVQTGIGTASARMLDSLMDNARMCQTISHIRSPASDLTKDGRATFMRVYTHLHGRLRLTVSVPQGI